MERGKLFFTIGLPRSGKSTYCDRWVRQAESTIVERWSGPKARTIMSRPRAIVAGDDFRKALHGNSYISEAEPTVFSMMDASARALLSRGFDVIIDETCTTEETLKRYLRIDDEAIPVWIDTPYSVCKQRAIDSGKSYLLKPIERIAEQFHVMKRDWTEIYWRCQQEIRRRKELDNQCV